MKIPFHVYIPNKAHDATEKTITIEVEVTIDESGEQVLTPESMDLIERTQAEHMLSPEHVAIMEHTQNRAASGLYCGDSPEMQDLVRWGLMAYAGRKSFVPDSFFQLTGKGRELLTNRK